MQKLWMRMTTAICIVTMIVASPGITVFADEMTEVASTGSETVEATQEDATASTDDTDPATEPNEGTDSSDDSSDSLKPEDKDDLNSEDAESVETEPDTEEDLVGDGIFPGGFEVDPGDTDLLNSIANGVQAQSGITAASVTREFFTGAYRLGDLPQFWNTTVDGVNLLSSQCCGYANMFFYKLTGHTTYSDTYKVAQEYPSTAARLKEILAASKAGAHIRVEDEPHSMVFLLSEDEGFYMLHWNYGVGQCSYTTYDGFVSKYSGLEFFVDMPYDYPNDIPQPDPQPDPQPEPHGQTVSVGENVTAGFDSETGTVTFYSQGGTLLPCDADPSDDWAERLGISLDTVKAVTISNDSDVMYLPESSYGLFEGLINVQSINFSKADTSNVTDMGYMFEGCSSLQTLDVSGFDTSNVTIMCGMFLDCANLQTLDVSGFETSNVRNMVEMFEGCSNLQMIDVSGFDTSKVTDMYEMFYRCSSLQTLDVSGFDTSYVNEMNRMFDSCNSLQTLDISGFDMSNVVFGGTMFSDCSNMFVIMTPVNVHLTIDLPGTFADSSGTEYDTLPQGLSESIRLTRVEDVIPVDLEILSLSDDFYGKTGTPASFHIEAEGSGTVTYQWQYRTAGSTNWKTPSQASAKTADYGFNLKQSYDNIEVRCIVSDDSGNEVISETRKANVFAFTSQPADVTAAEGQIVNFEVSAIGRGVTYQWYYMRPNGAWRKTTVAGSNTAVLPITASTVNDGTSYRCVITDEEGNKITSSAGHLTLSDISLQVTGISEDAYDMSGKSVTFHVDAVGNGDLTYQWQYKLAGESTWRTPGQASAKTADYVFKLKPSYDNIEVRCIVKDTYGNSVTSDVRKANVFAVTQHPDHVYAELGESVTFAVEGIGQNLTYQWYYRRLEGDWKKVTVAGADTASLTITAQIKNNCSQYRCYVYDGLGNLIKSLAATLIERNEEYEG